MRCVFTAEQKIKCQKCRKPIERGEAFTTSNGKKRGKRYCIDCAERNPYLFTFKGWNNFRASLA